jgi:hypothetical protein
MNPEAEAAFRGFLYGIGGTIVATLLTSAFQFLLQWKQHQWGSAEKKHLIFIEKRLYALQNAIQLCDFLDSIGGVMHLSGEVQNDWRRIRRENQAQGAFMPKSVQQEFKIVLRNMDFEPYPPEAPVNMLPSVPSTDKLRKLCMDAIQQEYDRV